MCQLLSNLNRICSDSLHVIGTRSYNSVLFAHSFISPQHHFWTYDRVCFFWQLFALYGESLSIIEYSSSQHKLLLVGLFLCCILTVHWILKRLFPTFCISSRLTDINVQLLSLVSVTYPVVLVFLTCILIELHSGNNWLVCIAWKPFCFIFKKLKVTVATNNSVIDAFASFIFLANSTIFKTFITLFLQTNIHKPDGSVYKQAFAIDPTLEHGSKEHIPFINDSSTASIFPNISTPPFTVNIFNKII